MLAKRFVSSKTAGFPVKKQIRKVTWKKTPVTEKTILRRKNIHFEKSHNAENCKRGDPFGFLKQLLQNIKKNVGPFGDIKKIEKSHKAEQIKKGTL